MEMIGLEMRWIKYDAAGTGSNAKGKQGQLLEKQHQWQWLHILMVFPAVGQIVHKINPSKYIQRGS